MASNGAKGARQIWVSEEVHAAIAEKAHREHRKIRMESEVLLCEVLGYESLDALQAVYTPEYREDLRQRGILKTDKAEAKA